MAASIETVKRSVSGGAKKIPAGVRQEDSGRGKSSPAAPERKALAAGLVLVGVPVAKLDGYDHHEVKSTTRARR
jgi:hypothetical protein